MACWNIAITFKTAAFHITCATTTLSVSHYFDSPRHVYCCEYAYHELTTCVSRSASYVSCVLPLNVRVTRSAETSVNEHCALLCYCDYPEQHISEILRGGRLNSCTGMKWPVCKCIPSYLPVPPRINIFWLPLYLWSTSFTKRNIKWGRG